MSSWLQTLIRYSCLDLNACEDAICRADKPLARRLFRGLARGFVGRNLRYGAAAPIVCETPFPIDFSRPEHQHPLIPRKQLDATR